MKHLLQWRKKYIYIVCVCVCVCVCGRGDGVGCKGEGTHFSILSQYPDQCSLARRVWDRVQAGRQTWQDHLNHVFKLTENVYAQSHNGTKHSRDHSQNDPKLLTCHGHQGLSSDVVSLHGKEGEQLIHAQVSPPCEPQGDVAYCLHCLLGHYHIDVCSIPSVKKKGGGGGGGVVTLLHHPRGRIHGNKATPSP